jgi:TatD DNase family protein
MKLIDIGANLTHQSFEHDFDAVVAAAKTAGLSHIILTGTDLPTSEAALRITRQEPAFFSSTVGFHPHIAASVTEQQMQQAAELASHASVVAVGETGLDFNRNYSPPQLQQKVFEQHLELAVAAQKPLFLHQRDAHDSFLSLLRKYRDRLPGGVVHCFTDTAAALQDYLELDMYIGITGWICDERRGQSLQELVSTIPPQRLLVETDAPYLLPRTLQPKPKSRRNEPKYLIEVVNQVARNCDRDPLEVAKTSTDNAIRLFGLENQDF